MHTHTQQFDVHFMYFDVVYLSIFHQYLYQIRWDIKVIKKLKLINISPNTTVPGYYDCEIMIKDRLWWFGADLVKMQYLCQFSLDLHVLYVKITAFLSSIM